MKIVKSFMQGGAAALLVGVGTVAFAGLAVVRAIVLLLEESE